MREAMATANVLAQPIKSGEYVDMGSELSQLPDEVQVMLQGMADDSHLRFIQVVRAARPKLAALEDGLLFDGRVMTGQDALEAGLVDRVAGLPEVLDLARELSARPDASVLLFVRKEEQLRSIYATSYGGLSLQNIVPLSIPGLDRSKLPLFLYMWQPNPVPE